MKRFYKKAEARTESDGFFSICLDGRQVKTQSRKVLSAPTMLLAEECAREWEEQKEIVTPEAMPITQLLNTAIDKVLLDKEAFIQGIMAYFDTDLICYRTERPADLAERQAEIWDPALDWFEKKFNSRLETTSGLVALCQSDAAKNEVREFLKNMDGYRLTAVQMITSVTGSVVLALAMEDEIMNASSVFNAMHIEENYKSEVYNEEFHGKAPQQENRENEVKRDLEAGEKFLAML